MAGRKLIKKKKWVDTLPTGLKIGLSLHKSTRYHENEIDSFLNKSVISYRSSMQISEMFGFLNHKFDLMYGKFAFLHWFIQDGM
jgi:tubulin alpha